MFKAFNPRNTQFGSSESRAVKTQSDEKLPVIVDDEQTVAVENPDPDVICSIDNLISLLSTIHLPDGVKTVAHKNKVSFYKVSVDEKPIVQYCLNILPTLKYEIWLWGETVDIKSITGEKMATVINSFRWIEKVLNILDQRKIPEVDNENKMKKIIDELLNLGEQIGGTVTRKLAFICEQLSLLLKHRNGRRYSKEFLAVACMWQTISPALYKQMLADDIFTLPNNKYVRRLTGSITVENDLSDATIAYLKARISKLQEKDKSVNVVLDEIYVQMMVQYINGVLHGNENGEFTKTMLCIMLKSVAGSKVSYARIFKTRSILATKSFSCSTQHICSSACTAISGERNLSFVQNSMVPMVRISIQCLVTSENCRKSS